MGWLSKVVKKAKNAVSLKNVAKLGPIAAPLALTSGGRAALKNTYGGIGTAVVDRYTGGKGTAAFSAALEKFSPTPSAGGAGGGGGFFSQPVGGEDGPVSQTPLWLWLLLGVAAVAGVVVFIRRKKG